MIIIEDSEQTKIAYLRKDDILTVYESEISGDMVVTIKFKEYVSTEFLRIKNERASRIRSGLDDGTWVRYLRDFYWD